LTGGDTPKIRRAVAAEAAALTDLVRRSKAYWGYDDDFMAACRDELSVSPADIENGEIWVAETNRPVGLYHLKTGEEAEVEQLFIDPESIGSGLGRLLWDHLERRAISTGAQSLATDADPYARTFYEHMGMKLIGESPSGSIPGRFLPHLKKQLR